MSLLLLLILVYFSVFHIFSFTFEDKEVDSLTQSNKTYGVPGSPMSLYFLISTLSLSVTV